MDRVPYAEFLERMRERERERMRAPKMLEGFYAPRRREATEKVALRLTAEQKSFLEWASAASHDGSVSPSQIVAVAIAIVEQLDIPWQSLASRHDLVEAVKTRLEERR
jgi:hypothetical protein